MSYEPLYTINWRALDRMDPAERQEALAEIGEDVKQVVAAARARIVRTAVAAHGTQAEAARQLGLSAIRVNQILREAAPMVTITPVPAPDALYRHYRRELAPQPCHIELDLEERRLSADYDAEVGEPPAQPREVVYGLVRRYEIPPLTADAAHRVMEQIRPYAERICADWSQHWDGENHIAVLGDDARAAEAALLAHLGDPDDWDPADLVGGIPADLSEINDMVSADTTDSELDDLVAQVMAELAAAEPSGVVTSEAEEVIRDYLIEARNEARDDA